MKSLLLDQTAWDLVLDINGNIAVCTEPYAIAQDVACACRLFSGELWYAKKKGIPYFRDILGKIAPLALIKTNLIKAAMSVAGVVSAQVVIKSVKDRVLTGQVQFIDNSGKSHIVTF